jgi:hypothetical protein
MRHLLRVALILIVAVGILGTGASAESRLAVAVPQDTASRVWLNTRSGVYHCPGTRYYGTTKSGTYLSELDARSRGHRPAGGKACSQSASSVPLRSALPAGPRVWVNTNSGVYHCPGSRYYGKTKSGKLLGEREAADSGFRPAYNRKCS